MFELIRFFHSNPIPLFERQLIHKVHFEIISFAYRSFLFKNKIIVYKLTQKYFVWNKLKHLKVHVLFASFYANLLMNCSLLN